jgi:FkbH-like protein
VRNANKSRLAACLAGRAKPEIADGNLLLPAGRGVAWIVAERFMDAMNSTPDITAEKLINTTWAFGMPGRRPNAAKFGFTASGRIALYASPNEVFWGLQGGVLHIYRTDGSVMWRSAGREMGAEGVRIALKCPFDPGLDYQLIELAQPQAISDADFLVPKDLRVTPTQLQRLLLVGSCLTGFYKSDFAARFPDIVFDHVLFNFVREMPAQPPVPISEYSLMLIQLPLRFVLTDRVVWAVQLNEAGFLDGLLDDARTIIDAMLDAALRFNRTSGILTLVSNFIVPQMPIATHAKAIGTEGDLVALIRRLNDHIARAIAGLNNVFLLDADAVAASVGKRYVLDDMIHIYAHNSVIEDLRVDFNTDLRGEPVPEIETFYPPKKDEFYTAMFDQIVALYRIANQIDQVKAVIFDLDNTLWRGQIAEHYGADRGGRVERDGWPMGLWEAIHHLRARGILVAICSKNDLRSVQDKWDVVVDPLFVKLSDFVSVKINWRDKSENILEICQAFGIRPKSVVLVDDNPVERAAAKAALPDLRVIGANPYLVRRILLWAPETRVAHLTDESGRREDMVRNQMVREETRGSLTRAEFLGSLGSIVTFVPILDTDQKEFSRVLELVNKTNQFNTTGKRWTNAEMAAFFAGGGRIAAFRAKDKFADYGLIGTLFASGPEIVQFVMSCRVLGMEIEQFAVAKAIAQLRSEHPRAATVACLRETEDNMVCRDVFAKAGFRLVGRDGAELRFELGSADPIREPSHIRMEFQAPS